MAHNPFMGLPDELLLELTRTLAGWIPFAGGVREMVNEALHSKQRTIILGGLRQEIRLDQKVAIDRLMTETGCSHLEASEMVRDMIRHHAEELSKDIDARKIW